MLLTSIAVAAHSVRDLWSVLTTLHANAVLPPVLYSSVALFLFLGSVSVRLLCGSCTFLARAGSLVVIISAFVLALGLLCCATAACFRGHCCLRFRYVANFTITLSLALALAAAGAGVGALLSPEVATSWASQALQITFASTKSGQGWFIQAIHKYISNACAQLCFN